MNATKLRQLVHRWTPNRWNSWPERAYQRQAYQQRLLAVQEHLAACLDIAPIGRVRILSMCSGDGRDVIGVLRSHPRRGDATACLVELSAQSVAIGLSQAKSAGLDQAVEFITGNATDYATYENAGASDVVLVCGVWGHVPVDERSRLVDAVASFCAPGAAVIWTRGASKGMDQVREIQSHFAQPNWEEARFNLTADEKWAVATHRYRGPRIQKPLSGRIFNFRRAAGR